MKEGKKTGDQGAVVVMASAVPSSVLHLILTVGTGTAGKSSNLQQGLINTLRQLKPASYWLVPSSSPDSIATADLVRSECPEGFAPWSSTAAYRILECPDDLLDCRAVIREVIAVARRAKGRLVINPTSGTKQMSAAATLAALDEEVGEIVFTVGERADGVVVTGTERVTSFSTAQFLRERDLREADGLYRSGAFDAVGRILGKWRGDVVVDRAIRIARCAHEWHRLNYRAAASTAACFDTALCAHLDKLALSVEQNELADGVLTDLLAGAEDLRNWGDAEEAATRAYKAMEYAARLALCRDLNVKPPLREEHFRDINLREPIRCPPGLQQMMVALEALQNPFAGEYAALRKPLKLRNDAMHDIRPVDPREAQSLGDRIVNAIRRHFPGVSRRRPLDLPASLT